MGRALLIICSGLFVMLGYVGINTSNQTAALTRTNVDYASEVKSKNLAQTAIQISMNEINNDPTWMDNHYSQGTAASYQIDGGEASVYVEVMSETNPTIGLNEKQIRIISEADYNEKSSRVVSVYKKTQLHFVPEFRSALTIATDQFTMSSGGNANINGSDQSGMCSDQPGILTQSSSDSSTVATATSGNSDITGNPKVDNDTTLSYKPLDQLIARLENMDGVQHISGNYKGEMGDSTDPGVFFIDDPANLTGGISEGYGIMVIRSDGELEYDGSLDIAGNFTFNGLVIFENAWNLDGKGTPTINGSVLVGNTKETYDLDVDLGGNINLNYNCYAQNYAQKASASLIKQNKYVRITTYE
ncbi:MAG: hypothetical protein R3222_08060 [Balneolaceae bacterium]|nr:hypothetical protein [Balneolaceae bacterium]